MAAAHEAGKSLAISIRGPVGVVDLAVPAGASVADVAREYAVQAALPAAPVLRTGLGAPLREDLSLDEAGVASGALLVADLGAPTPVSRHALPLSTPAHVRRELPTAWFAAAAAAAALAAWFGGQATGAVRDVVAGLLLATTLLALLPVGREDRRRALTAPAFAAAAAWVVVWDPLPERLPLIVGIVALAGAVAAAAGRTLTEGDEALRVWTVAGGSLFLLAAGWALLDLSPAWFWSLVLVAALFMPRFVPTLAVDVPDQFLIDLDRLAINAWSARQVPDKRRRTMVPPEAVAQVASRAGHAVTAASLVILVLCVLAAPMLLASVEDPLDRIGARVLVLLTGAGVLLAARSYRHAAARGLMRLAGVACWLALLAHLAPRTGHGLVVTTAVAAVLLAAVLVLAGVATGRGWRSAWWSRRAEVAEALCGAAGLAALVVAVGLFRTVWENVKLG